ncbi:MAG: glycosyltransferase family 39 protein [Saonia sp.]
MLKKTIDFLTPKYLFLKNRGVFLILFLIALFVRFPFFFRDYIDRDESTFILMGQSWVNGYLPYMELWDLKPPVTYLFFASIIAAFGKSFFAIRLFGTLAVVITAFFTYKIGETIASKKIGFWSGILCVLLLSMFGSLQGVMSEHICMVFFMSALYILVVYRKWYWYALAGLLMGLALMTKLNLAYALCILGLFLGYRSFRHKEYKSGIFLIFSFGIGILTVIGLTVLPYYLEGNAIVWWKSVILAPLEYAGARRYSVFKMAPVFLVLSVFFIVAWKKKYLDTKDASVQILLVAIIGVLFSFIRGGRINGHYLIQLHPILIILVGITVSKLTFLKKFDYRPYVLFLLVLLPMEAYLEYGAIIRNKIEKGSFYNGEGIDVPSYILNQNMDTENILFFEYHIGYWLLEKLPPTKSATHPSSIFRGELFPFYDNPRETGLEELKFIMEDLRPRTLVVRKNKAVFDKKIIDGNNYINAYIAQNYRLVKTIDRAEIYQRLE